ncbi:hypothetical protein DID88_001178 [Monilinia fructigena]|uniref:Uncharacterized protein n=1 Tax=Monilinia fructigena TaxID=38457 RepID=A0A395IY37_9HELO|nr:hypothetical protein DID88_001178 [Monilinia fructigena]
MVSARKRGRQEMEAIEVPKEPSMIDRLRICGNLQILHNGFSFLAKVSKSTRTSELRNLRWNVRKHTQLFCRDRPCFIKNLSPLTEDSPPERNPFGTEEEPAKFAEFDAFTKIRVLQQLTQWAMISPERIRERMERPRISTNLLAH